MQTAELQEHAHGVRVAYLQLFCFLAHAVGLHAIFFDFVEVGLVVQLKPHDVAWLGIFATKRFAIFGQMLTIFIHAYHAHVG